MLAAPLPLTVAPHPAGMGCAISSTGAGFADVQWGIPARWTVLPKRCKCLTQPQGGRQAAICDRHVHAQQGGAGDLQPPFSPPLLPPVLESCLEVLQAPRGCCSTLSPNGSLTQREDISQATRESGRRRRRCRPGSRGVSRTEGGAQGCQGRYLASQSWGVAADLAG